MTTAGVGPGGAWVSATDVPQGAPGPDGSIGSGLLADRPLASAVAYGATYWVTFTSGGLTMRPVRYRATLDRTGAAAWAVDGRQVLFSEGGTDSAPVRTVTAAAAAGTIGTLGTIPANMLSPEGTCLETDVIYSRGATATQTVTFATSVGGVAVAVLAAVTANADRAARIAGAVWARTTLTQTCTYNIPYLGQATSGVVSSVAITSTSDCAITADFSSATTGDILQVSAFTVWIQ